MKFSAAAVFAALAASVTAVPEFTNSGFDLTPGSTFTLTWSNATGPVNIVLATGPSTNLVKVQTIDSNDSGSSFTWTVPTTLATGTYAFEISDETGTNFSKSFTLTGTGTASASATTASSTGVTSTGTSTSTSSSTSGSTTTSTTSSSSSARITTTTSSNHTTTATKSTSSTTKATASTTVTPANTNNGPQAKSPLAFVLVTVAALLYFN